LAQKAGTEAGQENTGVEMNTNDFTDDLVLRLGPELGKERAEKLKLIHSISTGDEERQKRIERILKLSSSKLLNDNLIDSLLLPPSTKDECGQGEITLGDVCYGFTPDGRDRVLYPLKLNIDLDGRNHISVVGMSGAGKTVFSYNLAIELAKHGKTCLIFDWTRSWRGMLGMPKDKKSNAFIENIRVFTIGRDINPLKYNVFFSPPEGTSTLNWLGLVAGKPMAKAFLAGQGVENLVLNEAENLLGLFNEGKLKLRPNASDMKIRLEKKFLKSRESLWQQSALRCLSETLRPSVREVFNSRNPVDIAKEILERPGITIIELDMECPVNHRIFLQEVFLHYTMLYFMHKGETDKLRIAIFAEEFVNMLDQSKTQTQAGSPMLKHLLKESRKYGIGMVIIGQEASEVPNWVMANCKTSINFFCSTYKDITATASGLYLKPHQIPYLGLLTTGKAIAQIRGRTKNMLIRTPPPPFNKKISDEELREITKKWQEKN